MLARDDRFRDCVAIVGFLLLATAILRPFQNTPYIDDWIYAWSVERLRLNSRLQVLDFSLHANVTHIVWGWLFTVPFGFSFVALRWSTFTLAAAALCAMYLLLGRLDVGRREALVGTAALAVYPVFAILGASFMTDVPFVSITVLASYAAVTAIRHHSTRWLVVATVLGSLAVGVRIIGLVMPVALCASLVVSHDAWGRRRGRWAIALAPIAVFACLVYWSSSRVHHIADVTWLENSVTRRLSQLHVVWQLLPAMSAETVGLLVGCLGLALLPLSLATLRRETLLRTAGFAIAIGGVLALLHLAGTRYPLPLDGDGTWRFDGLGFTPLLVPFYGGPDVPAWLAWAALKVAVLSIASVAAVACRRRSLRPGEPFLFWMLLGHAGALPVLWLIHDRYVLVFVPLAVALLLTAQPRIDLRVAAGGLLLFALISAAGIRDHLHYNASLWAAVEALDRAGVPPSEVDGGYVVNGWRQYAHPEHAPRAANGEVDVPWVNGGAELPYAVANSVPEGWIVLDRFAYRRLMGSSGYAVRAASSAGGKHGKRWNAVRPVAAWRTRRQRRASRAISRGSLSVRSPTNFGCRRWPSRVHSTNATSATSSGRSHRSFVRSSIVSPSPHRVFLPVGSSANG